MNRFAENHSNQIYLKSYRDSQRCPNSIILDDNSSDIIYNRRSITPYNDRRKEIFLYVKEPWTLVDINTGNNKFMEEDVIVYPYPYWSYFKEALFHLVTEYKKEKEKYNSDILTPFYSDNLKDNMQKNIEIKNVRWNREDNHKILLPYKGVFLQILWKIKDGKSLLP